MITARINSRMNNANSPELRSISSVIVSNCLLVIVTPMFNVVEYQPIVSACVHCTTKDFTLIANVCKYLILLSAINPLERSFGR